MRLTVSVMCIILSMITYAKPPLEVLRTCIDQQVYSNLVTFKMIEGGQWMENPNPQCDSSVSTHFEGINLQYLSCENTNYLAVNDKKIDLKNVEDYSVTNVVKPGSYIAIACSWSKIEFEGKSYLCIQSPLVQFGHGAANDKYYIFENAFNDLPLKGYFYFFNKNITAWGD